MARERFKKILKGEYVERFLERFLAPAGDKDSPLPKTMDDLMVEVRDVMDRKGLISPGEMAGELMARHGQEDNPAFGDFMRQAQKTRDKPDPVMKSGFLRKENGYLAMGLSHLYAVEMDQPVMFLFGDFSKMGLTNDYFFNKMIAENGGDADKVSRKDAEAKTDRAMQVVAKTTVDSVKRVTPKAQTLQGRLGGDEFCVIAAGVDPDKFAETVGVVNARNEEQVAYMGLQAVAPDEERGFGAGVAVIDMRDIEDPHTVIRDLDGAVQVNKTTTTLLRRGKMDSGIMLAEIESAVAHGRIAAPEDMGARDAFIREKASQTAEQARRSAEYLRGLNPANTKEGATIEGFMKHVDGVLGTESARETFPSIFDRKVTGEQRPSGLPPLAPMYDRRLAVADRHLLGQGITLSRNQRTHLEMCVRDLEPMDPSADRMMPGEMVRLIEMHAAEGPEYADKHDHLSSEDRSMALGVSTHVIGGANEDLGHDAADILQKELGHALIEGALRSMGIPVVEPPLFDVSHSGAGAFTVLLKPGVGGGLSEGELEEEFGRALSAEVAELNEKEIAAFLRPHGIELDEEYLRGEYQLGQNPATFASIRDKKKRRVESGGKTYESRVDGVHVAVSARAVPDDPALDGGKFLDALQKAAEVKMDRLREMHIVRHEVTTRPAMHRPTSMPPHRLTEDEARMQHIESLHAGQRRTTLISDLVRHTTMPPPGEGEKLMPTIPPHARVPRDAPEI